MSRMPLVVLAALAGTLSQAPLLFAQGLAQCGSITVLAADHTQAEVIAQQASQLRDELLKAWLPAARSQHLEMTISVRLDAAQERSLSFPVKGEHGTWYKISLVAADEAALAGSLRRELTRVVIGHRQDGELSPWIAAGIAGQGESGERGESQRQMLDWFARTGNWPELPSLFAEKHLVDADRAGLAAATSVVELLLARHDRRTLLEFADDAALIGWDESLEKHYGLAGVAALETAWHAAQQPASPRLSAVEGTLR